MAASNIFQTLRDMAEKTKSLPVYEKRAMFWFRNFNKDLMKWQQKYSATTFGKLIRDPGFESSSGPFRVNPGQICLFLYDPKLSDTLPHYDLFPMVMILNISQDSFLGLNFHYLNYHHRALLFDALFIIHKAGYLTTRPDMSYDLLNAVSKYRMFRPCLKRYLFSQIQSPILQFTYQDWELGLFLPIESFVKESKQVVWAKSEQKF